MGSIEAPKFDPTPYAHPLISERAIDQARPLKVIYIGAGISGIDAAIQFPKYVPGQNLELVIYEKNADVGGTWFENRYPGCACDIPAHSYQFSFESNTQWSSFYAGQKEIWNYWKAVAEKYGVRKYMRFKMKCVEARWNEERAKWTVKLLNLETGKEETDESDVFMIGTGVLNEWKWPALKGLRDVYKGKIMHSADWDESFNFKVSSNNLSEF